MCYKHQELLRQARETCIASRAQEEEAATSQTGEGGEQGGCEAGEAGQKAILGLQDSLMEGLGDKLREISEVMEDREEGEGVTSIVYTDEGGREQSLVGKIVYQTDETGQSNIIIQEVQPRQVQDGKKLVKLDLGDMEGYMMAGPGEGEEALEQRLEEELEGSEARLEEELEFQASVQAGEEVGGKEGGQGSELEVREGQYSARTPSGGQYSGRLAGGQYSARLVVPSLQGMIQATGIPAHLPQVSLQGSGGLVSLQAGFRQAPLQAGVRQVSLQGVQARPGHVTLQSSEEPGSFHDSGGPGSLQGSEAPTPLQGRGGPTPLQGSGGPSSLQGSGGTRPLHGSLPEQAPQGVQGRRLVPIFPRPPVMKTEASDREEEGSMLRIPKATDGEEEGNMLKIQYKEYELRILASEMRPLLSQAELCDTVLVCRDGRLLTSSLVLACLSPFLRAALDSAPRLDPFKTVILPEEISISQVILLNKIMFDEVTSSQSSPFGLSLEQQEQVRELADVLDCPALLHLTALQGREAEVVEVREARGVKRPAAQSPARKRPTKTAKAPTAPAPPSVKLEKNDLNSDYIDTSGLVRLSTVEEMAVHFCLLCEGKFKKYTQAVTHYDSAHSLVAALACDQCDETFRDMYSCVKHKHEFHGQFDANFQCYICQEVSYSRFRLGTHIKECHKQFFGEFVCRTCGMKFSAQHYLTKHLKETHNDSANTCNICQKSFSGRRYLTMHMKANHESGGGGEALSCSECDRGFPSQRDRDYHASKVHGKPRPEGAFEDCGLCDKWFKTKGELGQHMGRVHQVVLAQQKGGDWEEKGPQQLVQS